MKNRTHRSLSSTRISMVVLFVLLLAAVSLLPGGTALADDHNGSIGDLVWFDANENGIQDAGEAPVPGVTVKLFDAADQQIASTTTDSNGQYHFSVNAGTYHVRFILPPGYHFTQQGQGSDASKDSDANPADGNTVAFSVGSSEQRTDIDAGLIRDPNVCFGVADSTTSQNDGSAEDTLAYLDRSTGATAAVGNNVGNTGTYNIEAIAFEPGGGTLFAADAGQLGTLDLITGQFTALPQPFGSGSGYINGSKTTKSFSDVDSLSFDPTDGLFYGVTRRSGLDLLFVIDPSTGAHVPGAFPDPYNPSNTVDFVEVQAQAGLEDIDDIAADPVTGFLYGSANNGSSTIDKLVIINKSTGATTDVGTIRLADGTTIQDVEGLSFFNDGMLYGTTGKSGPTTNALYRIDKATGIATLIGQFTEPLRDFEGSDCLSGNAFVVIEKSTNGEDADVAPGPTIPVGDPVTWTYFVRNTGNLTLVNVVVTDDQLPGTICTIPSLAPGQSNVDVGVTCSASGTATQGQYANIGTVQAEVQSSGDIISDTDPSHYTGEDFHTAAIGDFVWHDLFHSQTHKVDGIQDSGEPGLSGVVVELYDGSGLLASTTTDGSGYYEFTSLLPGTYTVKIADSNFNAGGALEGWYASPPNASSNDAIDSDGDRTNHEATVTLSLGEINHDVDFGFFKTAMSFSKSGPASVQLGDTITYLFRVENTGDVVLHGGVSVYDPLINPAGDHEIWNHVVWPGEVYEFSRTYTPTEYQCGDLVNTATAIGHPLYPDGTSLPNITLQDSATVFVDCPQPDLDLQKSFNTPDRPIFIVGESVSFDIVTTNTGNSVIGYLPLRDDFDNICLSYSTKSSQPPESSFNNAAGTINWTDLTLSNGQNLGVGAAFTTTVHFEVTGVNSQGYNVATVEGARDVNNNLLPTRTSEVNFSCVDARISITPGNAVNAAGDPHVFTITVEKNLGDGNGWVPAPGVYPVVTVSPTPDSVTDTCASTGTDASGQCTVTINNNSGGQFSAHAAADIDFGSGAIAHRETDGSSGNSDDASKTYVNARLTLSPSEAANQVGDQHTFIAHLEFDYGDGNGWVNAPTGETINFSKVSGPGALGASSCTTDASGQCSVTLDSSTTGLTSVSASWSGSISATHSSASASATGSATKLWVDANISITPAEATNSIGDPHTFTVTVKADTGSGMQPVSGAFPVFSINPTPDSLTDNCASSGTDANGQCTVIINHNSDGTFTANASVTFQVAGLNLTRNTDGNSGPGGSGPAVKHYISTSVGDFVWNDLDADGIQEAGEPPINGLTVWLFDTINSTQYTTTTDVNGVYTFTALPLSSYYVQFDLPTGGKFSPQDQGSDDTIDSDPDPTTGKTTVFSLNSATADLTRDAGQYCLNPISGIVFYDNNQDGIQGLGEPGIPDVVLDLWLDDGDGIFDANADTLVMTTTTDAFGSYNFPPQEPGDYFVVENQPDGYDSTTPNMRTVTVVGSCAGASSTDNNFGEITGSIGDMIFLDSNGNAVQDAGETQGVVGVLVTVTNVSTGAVYTDTSDANGIYTIPNLPAGTYQIDVPANLPGLQRTTSAPIVYTLSAGENYVDADFGYISPTAVEFVDLSATTTAKGVLVSWQTVSEQNESSFRVWRSSAENGAYKAIGVVQATNNPSGASYSFLDKLASPDSVNWYKIESMATGAFFGPVPSKQEPNPGGSNQLFIPFVTR